MQRTPPDFTEVALQQVHATYGGTVLAKAGAASAYGNQIAPPGAERSCQVLSGFFVVLGCAFPGRRGRFWRRRCRRQAQQEMVLTHRRPSQQAKSTMPGALIYKQVRTRGQQADSTVPTPQFIYSGNGYIQRPDES